MLKKCAPYTIRKSENEDEVTGVESGERPTEEEVGEGVKFPESEPVLPTTITSVIEKMTREEIPDYEGSGYLGLGRI